MCYRKNKKMARIPKLASLLAAFLIAGGATLTSGLGVHAQQSDTEIIANLAAGRVAICVAREAIVVGTASKSVEAGSRAPIVVRLDAAHLAVMFGAVEWMRPGTGLAPVRLDTALADVGGVLNHPLKSIELEKDEAGDIEQFGIAFLEKLRAVTSQIHHPLELKPDEPLISVVLVDFAKDYGPEAWVLNYRVKQRMLQDDFYDTQALRPAFTQLYPPEKKEPKTIVEFRYPEEKSAETFAAMLGENDPRLAPARSDPKVAKATQFILDGASNKADPAAAAEFMKGALAATSDKTQQLSLAILYEDDRFAWVIEPKDAAAAPPKRDSDAPTLRKPHQ